MSMVEQILALAASDRAAFEAAGCPPVPTVVFENPNAFDAWPTWRAANQWALARCDQVTVSRAAGDMLDFHCLGFPPADRVAADANTVWFAWRHRLVWRRTGPVGTLFALSPLDGWTP